MNWYSKMRNEVFPYKTFYHITKIENVKKILKEERIWSNNYVKSKDIIVWRIDNQDINLRRSMRRINGTNYTLDKFVPFLLNPRGPFLRNVTEGGKNQCVVMLGFKEYRPNQLYYFTDGNAASYHTKFYGDMSTLSKYIDIKSINLKWDQISNLSPEVFKEVMRKHQSEVLLYQSVDLQDINHIIVQNIDTKLILDKMGCKIEIIVDPKMFFG
jgi:hypothetical protein